MGFPTIDAYLARLPQGIRSYPEVQAKGALFLQYSTGVDLGPELDQLPPELANLLRKPPAPSDWIPEVMLHLVVLARIQKLGLTEAQHLDQVYEQNRLLLQKPLYKLLLLVATPSMLIHGIANRFATFHRGISISALPKSAREFTIIMSFPSELLPPLALRAFGRAFTAAVETSGARGVQGELVEYAPTHGIFRLTYEK